MITAWAHLPNAAAIDRVIADVARRPEAWAAALGAAQDAARAAAWDAALDAALGAARGATQDAARAAAWDAVRGAARAAAWDAVRDAAWDAVRGAARAAAWDAAWPPCAALIAWDDAGEMLDVPVPALRLFAASGSHAALLLLPAVVVLGGSE